MKYNLEKIIIYLCIASSLFIGCGKSKIEENNNLQNEVIENENDDVKTSLNNLINNIKDTNPSLENENLKYKVYNVYDNYSQEIKYNLSGKIVFDSELNYYVSVESKNYCYFKDFLDKEIKVFNISEKEKCHKIYINGDSVNVNVVAQNLKNKNEKYESSTVINNDIKLVAKSNFIDCANCTYRWFRNQVEIPNTNINEYKIKDSVEDANYSFELTTSDGKKYNSDIFHVVIKK